MVCIFIGCGNGSQETEWSEVSDKKDLVGSWKVDSITNGTLIMKTC